MGQIKEFEPEKLIMGIIYSDTDVLSEVLKILTDKFGEIEDVCEEYSFSDEFSTYYDEELGGKGTRRICTFHKLVPPDMQAEIKEFTNEVEARFSRRINLDPGLLSTCRLMLPTTKPIGFRIPLKNGIHTELTLFYSRGGWHKFPWTYRDYQSQKVQRFLSKVRNKYLKQRKINRAEAEKLEKQQKI